MIHRTNYEIWFIDYLEGNLSSEDRAMVERFIAGHPDLKQELDEMKQAFLPPSTDIYPGKALLQKGFDALPLEEQIIAYLEGDTTPAEAAQIESLAVHDPKANALLSAYRDTHLSPTPSTDLSNLKSRLHQPVRNPEEIDDLVLSEMDGSILPADRAWLHRQLTEEEIQRRKKVFASLVLKPDPAIVYPHKSRLKHKRSVVPLWNAQVLRFAAAILLLIGLGWFLRNSTTNGTTDTPPTGLAAEGQTAHPQAVKHVDSATKEKETRPNSDLTTQQPLASNITTSTPTGHSLGKDSYHSSNDASVPQDKHRHPNRSIASHTPNTLERSVHNEEVIDRPVASLPSKIESVAKLKRWRIAGIYRRTPEAPVIAIAPIQLDEERQNARTLASNFFDNSPFELEIPPTYSTVISSFVKTGETYLKEKVKNKSVIAFNLGAFSFYKSTDL